MPHVVFLNRSYYPDSEATGQLLTELCQDLAAKDFQVTVIAGQPNQNPQNVPYRKWGAEQHHGVTIRRVWHTRLPKRWLPFRAINLLTYLFAASVTSLTLRKRPDVVVVETDPPLLCILGAFLKRRYRCRLIVYLQDLYPDLAIALGKLRHGVFTKWLRRLFIQAYAKAEQVVVLSSDMRDVLVESGIDAAKVSIVPNWTDCERITPRTQNNAFRTKHLDERTVRRVPVMISDKSATSTDNCQLTTDNAYSEPFLVMYAGNMGLCQGLEHIVVAAERLTHRADIVFVFVGDGVKRRELEHMVETRNLANVRFVGYQPAATLSESLSAADIHLVPLDSRVSRFLMPSKLYGVLASGTPVIAIAEKQCELAQIVESEEVGYVVEPNDSAALANLIEGLVDHTGHLDELGNRARALALREFDRPISINRFKEILKKVSGGSC